jgi:hypothetical protein
MKRPVNGGLLMLHYLNDGYNVGNAVLLLEFL